MSQTINFLTYLLDNSDKISFKDESKRTFYLNVHCIDKYLFNLLADLRINQIDIYIKTENDKIKISISDKRLFKIVASFFSYEIE